MIKVWLLVISLSFIFHSVGFGVDWGFCVIVLIMSTYYALFVLILYIVIIKDSRYIYHNKLDDDLLEVERVAGMMGVVVELLFCCYLV